MSIGRGNLSTDPSAIAGLVRLRAMLQRAESDASDPTEISRHIAIVTLDAAVENAMRTSAHYRGLALRPDVSFHDSLNKLMSDTRLAWTPEGVRGVLELHAARNLVQHVGILPDADRLAGWAVDVRAFIGGLVGAAFETDLDQVLMAGAIRDSALRELITRAEEALDAEDPVQAFRLADEAFRAVRLRWRERRRELRPGVGRGSPVLLADPDPTSPEGVADYQEVQTFASGMASYTQLLATRRHLQSGGPQPDMKESQQALVFVFDWILGWELFEAGYPTERYAEYWTRLGPPEDGGPPSVAWAYPPQRRPKRPQEPEVYEILVQLKNLPEHGRGNWGIDLPSALDRAQDEAGVDRQRVTQVSPLSLGSMMLLVNADLGPDVFAQILNRAVEIVTESYETRKTSEPESIRRAAELQDELRQAIAGVTQNDGIYEAPTVRPELTPQGATFRVRIPLINATPQDANLAHGGFASAGRHLAGAVVDKTDVTFQITDVDEELMQQLREVLASTQDTILRYRRADAQAEIRIQDYWHGVAAILGEPPPSDS